MNTREEIEGFLELETIAMAGLSRDPGSFSARVYDELTKKGFRIIPINPKAETIMGARCYPTLSSASARIDGVLVFTPPRETASIVRDAAELGIQRIWIQLGAESEEAILACENHHLLAVTKHCILMYAKPVGPLHSVHRFFKCLVDRLPF